MRWDALTPTVPDVVKLQFDSFLCLSMTKYIGESIAVRSGRRTDALLGGDRRKAMETFMKTGKHPIIEHTRQENASDALKPLPTVDHNRPHVFIDVSQRPGVSGRIVVELLEDMFPALCAAFRNRCHEV